jgi:hypothetical protein
VPALGRQAAEQTTQRARVGRVDLEGGAQRALGVDGTREHFLVDACEGEEGRQPWRGVTARRRDRLEGVDRLGPRALRNAEL